MKLRKLILTIKYYFRLKAVKRKLVKSRLDLAALNNHYRNEEKKHQLREKDLEILLVEERDRVYQTNKAWADRFLELQKLRPMMITPSEELRIPGSNLEKQYKDASNALAPEETDLLLDFKDQFWKDGYEINKSESEILSEWNLKLPDIVQDVKQQLGNF